MCAHAIHRSSRICCWSTARVGQCHFSGNLWIPLALQHHAGSVQKLDVTLGAGPTAEFAAGTSDVLQHPLLLLIRHVHASEFARSVRLLACPVLSAPFSRPLCSDALLKDAIDAVCKQTSPTIGTPNLITSANVAINTSNQAFWVHKAVAQSPTGRIFENLLRSRTILWRAT